MGVVLRFRTRERTIRRDEPSMCGGEVVIFPGVRYEYWGENGPIEEETASKPKRKGQRRRKRVRRA